MSSLGGGEDDLKPDGCGGDRFGCGGDEDLFFCEFRIVAGLNTGELLLLGGGGGTLLAEEGRLLFVVLSFIDLVFSAFVKGNLLGKDVK
jgi:hypothetical protein